MTKSNIRRSETIVKAIYSLPRLHKRKRSFYETYIKRGMDIICSLLAIVFFSWLYLSVAVMVKVRLGSPVLFRQPRPGMADPETGRETIFYMYNSVQCKMIEVRKENCIRMRKGLENLERGCVPHLWTSCRRYLIFSEVI